MWQARRRLQATHFEKRSNRLLGLFEDAVCSCSIGTPEEYNQRLPGCLRCWGSRLTRCNALGSITRETLPSSIWIEDCLERPSWGRVFWGGRLGSGYISVLKMTISGTHTPNCQQPFLGSASVRMSCLTFGAATCRAVGKPKGKFNSHTFSVTPQFICKPVHFGPKDSADGSVHGHV